MKAKMIKDVYIDLVYGYEYTVKMIFFDKKHIMVDGSPRRYEMDAFRITKNGKILTKEEAYRQFKLQIVREKLGIIPHRVNGK